MQQQLRRQQTYLCVYLFWSLTHEREPGQLALDRLELSGNLSSRVPNCLLSVAFEGSRISVHGGIFSGATSKRGGFIYAEDDTRVTITGGLIEDNFSSSRGGAVSDQEKCQMLHNQDAHRSTSHQWPALLVIVELPTSSSWFSQSRVGPGPVKRIPAVIFLVPTSFYAYVRTRFYYRSCTIYFFRPLPLPPSSISNPA